MSSRVFLNIEFVLLDNQNVAVKDLFQIKHSDQTFNKRCLIFEGTFFYAETFLAVFKRVESLFTVYFKKKGCLIRFVAEQKGENKIALTTDSETDRFVTHAETVDFLQTFYIQRFMTKEEREYLSCWTALLFHIQRRLFHRNGRALARSVLKHFVWKTFKAYGPLNSQSDVYFLVTEASYLFVVPDRTEATQYSILFEALEERNYNSKDLRPVDVYAIFLGLLKFLSERDKFTLAQHNCLLSSILKSYDKQHPHTKFATDVRLPLLRKSHQLQELVSTTPNQDIGDKLKAVLLWFLHLHRHEE